MAYQNVEQPEIINITKNLRLRKYDGDYKIALSWYQDPYVYYHSEGISEDDKKPDLDYIKRMYEWLEERGELYFIEILENEKFIPIGDVTLKPENPPIAIGVEKYRGMGIGKSVMETILKRASQLGIKKISGSRVYLYNIASQRLHESLGFKRISTIENEIIYEIQLEDIMK